MSEFWAEVSIHLLSTESGGRPAPLDLSDNAPGPYRPHLRVTGGSSEMLGVAFMDGPDEPILPGGSTHATIKALYESNGVSYDELVEGARPRLKRLGRRYIAANAAEQIKRDRRPPIRARDSGRKPENV